MAVHRFLCFLLTAFFICGSCGASDSEDLGGTLLETESAADDNSEANLAFQAVLRTKGQKERTVYSLQFQHLLAGRTTNNLLLKLKDTETMQHEENESLLDPVFQWVDKKTEEHYAELKRIRDIGFSAIEDKLEAWNITGLVQTFFGAETGVSVLTVDTDVVDLLRVWILTLADLDVEFVDLDITMDLFEEVQCDVETNLRTDWGNQITKADKAMKALGYKEEGGPRDEKVLVAVIDTGVDYRHPLLKDRIWVNHIEFNGVPGVDDDGNGHIDDIHGWNFAGNDSDVIDTQGHGTHVAGIIVGHPYKNPRFSGVAPNAIILTCRFTSGREASISAAIQCLEYSVDAGAEIISNSWGGAGALSFALETAVTKIDELGIIQVMAAGNSGVDNDGPDKQATYPASYDTDSIIAVSAIDNNRRLIPMSNYGHTKTDIGAPGFSIVSTYLDEGFTRMSGTSQATPYVSAAAAMLLGACRHGKIECTAMDIKNAILSGSQPSPALTGKVKTGGYLNVLAAAKKLKLKNEELNEEEEEEENDLVLCTNAESVPVPSIPITFLAVCCLIWSLFIAF